LSSSASTRGSASSGRPNSVNASTASGTIDAAKISVGLDIGSNRESEGPQQVRLIEAVAAQE